MSNNYITSEELNSISHFIEDLETYRGGTLYFDVKISDVNGEIIGSVTIAESGEYAFYPEVDND